MKTISQMKKELDKGNKLKYCFNPIVYMIKDFNTDQYIIHNDNSHIEIDWEDIYPQSWYKEDK